MLFLKRTKHKLQLFHTSNEPALPTVNKGELKNPISRDHYKIGAGSRERSYGFKIRKDM